MTYDIDVFLANMFCLPVLKHGSSLSSSIFLIKLY